MGLLEAVWTDLQFYGILIVAAIIIFALLAGAKAAAGRVGARWGVAGLGILILIGGFFLWSIQVGGGLAEFLVVVGAGLFVLALLIPNRGGGT